MKVLYLKTSSKKLVLYLQEVALALFTDKGFIDDLETWVILNVLPAPIAMATS